MATNKKATCYVLEQLSGEKIATLSVTRCLHLLHTKVVAMADSRSQRRVTGLMSHIFPRATGIASAFSEARSENVTTASESEPAVATSEKQASSGQPTLRSRTRTAGRMIFSFLFYLLIV